MNAVPPKISDVNPGDPLNYSAAGNPLGWFVAIFCTLVALGVLATLFFFDPSRNHFYPVCGFHRLTGWNCPGCGATRALFALLHGNFQTALRDNALLVVGLPVLLLRAAWRGLNFFSGRPVPDFFPVKYFWPLLILTLIFSVLRNLPPLAFLSP